MLSKLQKFLLERKLNITKDVKIKMQNGEEMIFKIKSMNREQISNYNSQAIKVKANGETEIDDLLLSNLIIKNHCLEPDFNDAEFLKELGNGMPLRATDAINIVLTAGEASALASAIMEISGLNSNNFEIIEEEAKKS